MKERWNITITRLNELGERDILKAAVPGIAIAHIHGEVLRLLSLYPQRPEPEKP